MLLSLGTILLLSGCIDSQEIQKKTIQAKAGPEFLDTVPRSIADFSPHEPGTTWTMYWGVDAEPSPTQTSVQSVRRGGKAGTFSFVTTRPDSAIEAYENFYITDNSLMITGSSDSRSTSSSKISPPKRILVFPVAQDTKWEWEGIGRTMLDDDDVKHHSYFHVDTDVPLETRAGRFNTIRVEETQIPLDPRFKAYKSIVVCFYASGYGVVKQVARVVAPDGSSHRVTAELADSSLLKGRAKPKDGEEEQ